MATTTKRLFLESLGTLLCVIVLGVVTFGSFLLLPAHLHYHIEERYSLSTDGSGSAVYLGVLVPKSGPYQEVKNVNISWDGVQEREAKQNVEIIKLSGEIEDTSKRDAVISYDVILPQGKVSWEAPVEEFQRLPQRGIESDHPCIKEQVSHVTFGSTMEDVYRIYDFTSEYLVYSLGEKGCTSPSALTAFLTHKGVCGEFAKLMVAFSRASGISAQMISGITLPDLVVSGSSQTKTWGHPGESHAWVEFYSDGAWTMADPTVRDGYLKWLNFGRNNGRHLSYGEFEQESIAYREMQLWAYNQGNIFESKHNSLKFVASADTNKVSITPCSFVQKGWDSRWVNTIVTLFLTTTILCTFRARYSLFSSHHSSS